MWLESQIAQRVAAALDVPMSGKERAALARHMTESLDAYQWFLRGRLHFERRTRRDLREALAAFDSYRPGVVILDIGMPGMDGYQVARAIRGRPDGERIPLVAVTGWGQEEDRRRVREAGFDHHLVKPADIGALRALLGSL